MELYDIDLTLLAFQPAVISCVFEPKYNEVGTFAIELDEMNNLADHIVSYAKNKEHLVLIDGLNQGVVTGYTIRDKKMRIFGRSLSYILSFRILPPFSITVHANVYSLCNQLIKTSITYNAVLFPSFSDVASLNVANTAMSGSTFVITKDKQTVVIDTVIEILGLDAAGHEIVADVENKTFTFNVRKGESIPLILSEDVANIYETEYNSDGASYSNCGYYKRARTEGETTDTFVYISTVATGLRKKETALDGEILADATADLNKKDWTLKLKTKTIELLEKVDYNVGDLVKVQTVYGEFEKRIIGVIYTREHSNEYQTPILED